MPKVNVSLLMSALAETRAFSLPEMNSGTAYLFESVYKKLCDDNMIHLSELEYNRFDMEDIRMLSGLYHEVFEKNNNQTNHVLNMLEKSEPVCAAVNFA